MLSGGNVKQASGALLALIQSNSLFIDNQILEKCRDVLMLLASNQDTQNADLQLKVLADDLKKVAGVTELVNVIKKK